MGWKLLLAILATLIVVMPNVSANAATTIRGPVRGPTEFCPAPPDTFKVSGSGHGRYTLTVADDGTGALSLVLRGLQPNTAYQVYVTSLLVISNGELSECTSRPLGALIPDANGDATFGPEDAVYTVQLDPGTYKLQVLVTTNIISGVSFVSPPRTVTV